VNKDAQRASLQQGIVKDLKQESNLKQIYLICLTNGNKNLIV